MMHVVHVCASDLHGGAARAAFRLHRSFRSLPAVDSSMLVRWRVSDDVKIQPHAPDLLSLRYQYNLSVRRRILDLYWSKFASSNQVMHSRADVRTGLAGTLNKIQADVVHLHWLGSDTLSIEEIGQIDKPVVWTLHDMWTFCGAEHYVPDEPDARFRTGYFSQNRPGDESGPDMNRRVWERKMKAWANPMTLVCPSNWMAECARQSVLCKDWPIHCIPNPLELELWKPFPRGQARLLLNLPQDRKIVLFGAISGGRDPRKGVDLLREALTALKEMGGDVHLVVFGQSEPEDPLPFAYPVTYLGRFQDEPSMIAVYNAADLMLVPSRQDNLPQTAVEAQACGVPVVAFDIGGLADIIKHQSTGYLARPYDTADFARGIALLLEDQNLYSQMTQAARQSADEKFAAPVVAAKYAELYEQVLSNSVSPD